MEIKEEIVEELKKYFKEFDNYDKKLEGIEKKKNQNKDKVEKFNEKWGDDIFPSDKPIKEKEEEELKKEEKNIKDDKEKITKELESKVNELKYEKINQWKQEIEARRVELNEYAINKDKIIEQKNRLEKELQNQIDGIKIQEEKGVKPDDVIYKRRKEVVIPQLKTQIEEFDYRLNDKAIREEFTELGVVEKKLGEVQKWDRSHLVTELKNLFDIKEENQEDVELYDDDFELIEEDAEELEENAIDNNTAEIDTDKTKSATTADSVITTKTKVKSSETATKELNLTEEDIIKLILENNGANRTFIKLGRKIKVHDANGNKFKINSKKLTREIRDLANRDNYLSAIANEAYSDFKNIVVHEIEKITNIEPEIIENSTAVQNILNKFDERLDPQTISIFEGLSRLQDNEILAQEFYSSSLCSILQDDKKALKIICDKNDLSKGAFWPWNKKSRNFIVELAEESDIIKEEGEYEPNPFKRFMKKGKKAFQKKEEVAQITDGSEKKISPHTKYTQTLNVPENTINDNTKSGATKDGNTIKVEKVSKTSEKDRQNN